MPTISASFYRDMNHIPVTTDGVISQTSKTLVANNTTANVPIFTVAGTVEVRGLWGVVTTVLGSNNTAAYFRLNDATAQSDITLSTGTTLSASAVGSIIVKKGLAAAAVTLITSAQERVSEPTTLETTYFSPCVLVAKTAVTTNIEFTYSTTNAPTSGAIQFFIRWLPLSADGNITPL